MTDFIPVNEPLLDGNELAYLTDCINTGWISSEGAYVTRFEDAVATRCNRAHAISVSNGSVALELAFEALGIGPGDEVIVPDFTIISCVAPIVRRGAIPVTVDADALHWNMDVNHLEERITERTRAILVAHIYGLPVDMDRVMTIAEHYGLAVIEDAAEAHGLRYKERECGSFGDISIFSFYANKHVTTGEGGMVLTDDDTLAERLRSLRNLCFIPEQRFVHRELGYNARLSNLQAAVGLAQVESLDRHIERKREIGARYFANITGTPGVELAPASLEYATNGYWVFGLVLDESAPFDAKTAMRSLAERGVGTRPFFHPMHLQPVFRDRGLFAGTDHPVSRRLGLRGFYIPSGLSLSNHQVDEVSQHVIEVLKGAAR